MCKKIAIGCLGIFVLIAVVGGFAIYSFLLKPIMGGLETFDEIHQANTRIENQAPYQPPPGGALTPKQVERFVSVQREIKKGLEPKMAELDEKYKEVGDDVTEDDVSIRELLAAMEDLVKLYAGAKNIQVAALNQEGFSLEEYRFVQHAFYQGFGVGLLPYNLDRIAESANKRELETDIDKFKVGTTDFSQEALENNRQLASEYADSVEEWFVFAWLGL